MKKKAGIFDPWRQSAPPPVDETPARKTPTETPVEGNPPQHCVQFAGIRAGIFVWLDDQGDEDSNRARATIIGLVHKINVREGIAKILGSWGVFTGTPKQPNPIVLVDGDKKMTISVPVEDPDRLVPRAIDNLALALREVAQQFPDVRDTLAALKVHPYVK